MIYLLGVVFLLILVAVIFSDVEINNATDFVDAVVVGIQTLADFVTPS